MDDDRLYLAVRNDEHQYSIWLADRELPAGWQPVSAPNSKPHVLGQIEQMWTDMRPRSVRDAN